MALAERGNLGRIWGGKRGGTAGAGGLRAARQGNGCVLKARGSQWWVFIRGDGHLGCGEWKRRPWGQAGESWLCEVFRNSLVSSG